MSGISLGIVGGTGMLGGAMARAMLRAGVVAEDDLWLANRSGARAGFEEFPAVTVTVDVASLVGVCDVVLLSVPPAQAGRMDVTARGKLVVSVMAGVSRTRLSEITGAARVVRAMSSPAAELGLAWSPWIASGEVTEDDKAGITRLLGACGGAAEVAREEDIELFTAMTGPVPGFVAHFADSMVRYAVSRGITPEIADRAIRQLFLGAGNMMAEGAATPADHVREMINYAGTTAAGLLAMRDSGIDADIARALDAAVARTREIAG